MEKRENSAALRVGDWIVFSPSEGGPVLAHEETTGESVELRGALSRVVDPEAPASLRATLRQAGRINPLLARLSEVLGGSPREPLTVGSLLGRGGSWGLLFLELTGQCNERCEHCYAESSPERQESLSQQEVEGVISDAAALGFRALQLTGGDPLVSRTYLRAAQLARSLGIPRIEVYTNGLALSDRVADELADVGVDYSFSFFSHRPEIHDAITGTPGSQVRTLAAIERAVRRGARVRIGVISTHRNRADIPETLDLLEARGIPRERIGLDEERGVGRGTFGDAGALVPHQLLVRSPEERGVTPVRSAGGSALDLSRPHGSAGGGGKLCVSYRGDVYPCIFARGLPLGSIRERSLRDVLRAPLYPRLQVPRAPSLDDLRAELTCWECRGASRLLELLERSTRSGDFRPRRGSSAAR